MAFKSLYPATSSVALTLTLTSLADDNTNMLAGRASTAVDNTTNLDLDHVVSGFVKLGTSPTAGRTIEVWAYAPVSIASGTPTYPDSITGTDANKTMTTANVKYGALVPVQALTTDATTGRFLYIKQTSIASLFGSMPEFWGLFVVQGSGVALDGTAGGTFSYHRRQAQ